MHRVLLALAFVIGVDEDVVTLRLTFESMHCDDCKSSLEAQLKACKPVKTVLVEGETATVTMPEGAAPNLETLKKALPGDLKPKLKSISITARGVVSERKGLGFVPRGAAREYALVNRDEKPKPEDDQVGLLKKEMGGKNRFVISGELKDKEIVLSGFKKTDWKDEEKK